MKIAFLIGSVRGRGYKLDFLNESLQFLGRNFCTLIWFLAVKVPETLIDHVINFSW
jgi:hypothetical protein